MLVETFLPVFPGFYSTIFEPQTIEAQERDLEFFSEENFEIKPIDYTDICVKMVEKVETELNKNGFNFKFTFQKLCNPSQYNYANDSTDISIEYSESDTDLMLEYILENRKDFESYISSRYRSHSGFISFYSDKIRDWIKGFDNNSHMFGAVLDFILEHPIGWGVEELYDEVSDSFWEFEYLTDETCALIQDLKRDIKECYRLSTVEELVSSLMSKYSDTSYLDMECVFNPEFYNHYILEVYKEIENKIPELF